MCLMLEVFLSKTPGSELENVEKATDALEPSRSSSLS